MFRRLLNEFSKDIEEAGLTMNDCVSDYGKLPSYNQLQKLHEQRMAKVSPVAWENRKKIASLFSSYTSGNVKIYVSEGRVEIVSDEVNTDLVIKNFISSVNRQKLTDTPIYEWEVHSLPAEGLVYNFFM